MRRRRGTGTDIERPGRRIFADVAFNNDIGGAANKDEVLHIVASDQNKPATLIDRRRVRDGEPGLFPATTAAEARQIDGTVDKQGHQNDGHDDDERHEGLGKGPHRAKYRFEQS